MLRVAEYFQNTDTGQARPVNEDAVFARPPLFAVADGMGGAQAGEVASNAALALFEDGLPEGRGSAETRLAKLVSAANDRVHGLSQADAEKAGMGTTLTAAYLGESDVAIAHVGDSRLYCLRDGLLEQRTDDHSLVGELVRRGEISPKEAEEHPQRSIITRALGPERDVEVDHLTLTARDGDVFLLCSDGLTSMIGDAQIAEILTSAKGLSKAGRALVKAANAAGGRDNISVILFRVESVRGQGGPVDADQATGVIDADELDAAAAAMQAATRADDRSATDDSEPVARREPRMPPKPKRQRSALRSAGKGLLAAGVVIVLVGTAASIAVRSVYFVGTNDDGFVTVYRGMPYDLAGGLETYAEHYESGVNVDTLPPRLRKTIEDHELRSRDDANDLVRQIEQGKVAGQR